MDQSTTEIPGFVICARRGLPFGWRFFVFLCGSFFLVFAGGLEYLLITRNFSWFLCFIGLIFGAFGFFVMNTAVTSGEIRYVAESRELLIVTRPPWTKVHTERYSAADVSAVSIYRYAMVTGPKHFLELIHTSGETNWLCGLTYNELESVPQAVAEALAVPIVASRKRGEARVG